MRDVNSQLRVSHKKMSYHEFLWIYNNLFCKYRWSVLNIYFFNSRYFTIVRHSSHNRSRLPILVYGVIFLRGSLLFLYHMKKNDPWVILKKSLIFLQLECHCFSPENDPGHRPTGIAILFYPVCAAE